MIKDHPRGLTVIFFTEMFERFAYYTMFFLFALYMDERLGFNKQLLGNIYGIFTALVYFAPVIGGYLGDKYLGMKNSVVIGSVLMAAGYFILAIDNTAIFFIALGVIVLGNLFYKANMSALVGELYRDNDPRKDSAYNIFYMSVNIGALGSPFAAAYLRHAFNWGAAFMVAGAAMLVGLLVFLYFRRYVVALSSHSDPEQKTAAPSLSPEQERSRIYALFTVFVIVILFWMAFRQGPLTLTFWARDCTDTALSPEIFQSINPIFIIIFTPLLVRLWSLLRKRGKEPRTPAKLVWGMVLTALAFLTMMMASFAGGDFGVRVNTSWLVTSYAWLTIGELCLSPMGQSLVSKMSPPRLRARLMGGWFASTAIGNYLSGYIGGYWETIKHSTFFGILVVSSLFGALLLVLASKRINRAIEMRPKEGI